MNIELSQEIQEELKKELEPLVGRRLSEAEVSEAVFNLTGFAKVLMKMKKEFEQNGQ